MQEITPQFKTCSKCKIKKSTNDFYKHSQKKDGLNSSCRQCEKLHNKSRSEQIKQYNEQYKKQYYEKNKENIKNKSIEYYKNNKDKISESSKKRYIENKDKISEKQKNIYILNREKILAKSAEYYKNNRTNKLNYQKEYGKKYDKTEMGKAVRRNINSKRRSIIKSSDIDSSEIHKLIFESKVCYWCNTSLKNKEVHVDHYIPLARGGEHTISNLVVSCRLCNQKKHSKDPIVFANKLGRLL